MITNDQAQQLISGGGRVIGQDDEKIGEIGQVFLDDRSDEPEWVTVKTGLFGTGESFVPLRDASADGNDIRVPYDKATVKDAPRIPNADAHLSEEDEGRLFAHYGVDDRFDTHASPNAVGADTTHTAGTPGTTSAAGDRTDTLGDLQRENTAAGDHDSEQDVSGERGSSTVGNEYAGPGVGGVGGDRGRAEAGIGHDSSGPNTDSAMTRSEEQLHVGTETRTTGRARLRKYVVTENVTTTVPVSHEEVHVEREPITEANLGDATSGGELTSEEHEVVLHEERPVVEKETVPVERVRVDVDTVTGEQQVDEEVRKEQIDLDEDATTSDGAEADRTQRDGIDRG